MKKLISMLLATVLVLSLVLAIPASADEYMKYVNKKTLEAHKEPNSDSKVIKKLKGGQRVMLSGNASQGGWTSILVEDTKHGGQLECWVKTKYLVDNVPQEFCKHKWGKWKVTEEATCTEKGERVRKCKTCGKKEKESIKKLAHTYGKWKITEEATCSEEGTRVRTCKVCGHKDVQSYLEDHEYGKWKVTKEPTCTEKGERVRKCKVCGHKDKQALDMLPHDYEWNILVEATDHSAGTRAKVCKVCGKTEKEESYDPEGTLRRGAKGDDVRHMQELLVEQNYLNVGGADGIFGGGTEKALKQYQTDRNLNPDGIAWPQTLADLEHDYGPWETVKEMTRSEDGERVRVCQGCGYEQHEIIESGTVFERGRRGEDIRALQQIVKQLGYDAGSFDGIYGKKLDAAFADFAAANGLTMEDGKIRPTDVDAVVNAWFDSMPADTWMGEGDENSPVNLALTVTPMSDEDSDDATTTYSWSLTNLGSEKCTFATLLLTFGSTPNFKKNNLVMVLDGLEMKPNAGNSASGSFTVGMDWGEGNLNFAAMAVSEKTGAKWLSNSVVFEKAPANAAKTVAPQTYEMDVNALADGIYPVSFDRGDVLSGTSGIYMNAVHIFTEDWYDLVDINTLAVGDTLVVEGEPLEVKSVENREGTVVVNGGLDEGGVELIGEEDTNGYRVWGFDDLATYTEQGVTTLVIDPSATYTDASDIDGEPVTASYDGIVEAMQSSDNDSFGPSSTTVRIEAGKVVEINRIYVP